MTYLFIKLRFPQSKGHNLVLPPQTVNKFHNFNQFSYIVHWFMHIWQMCFSPPPPFPSPFPSLTKYSQFPIARTNVALLIGHYVMGVYRFLTYATYESWMSCCYNIKMYVKRTCPHPPTHSPLFVPHHQCPKMLAQSNGPCNKFQNGKYFNMRLQGHLAQRFVYVADFCPGGVCSYLCLYVKVTNIVLSRSLKHSEHNIFFFFIHVYTHA